MARSFPRAEGYYSVKAHEAVLLLESSEHGLSSAEARERLMQCGLNELPQEKRYTFLRMFLDQFKDPLILLLIFAGVLSLFLHEVIESIAIFVIVIINAVLGFVQEYKAEKAIEALKKISAPSARVMRDGKEQKLPARELVPGDIIVLESGDIVPADSRILEVSSLHIDEASLTGESVPSKKVVGTFAAGTAISDQENMAFMGTVVTYGKGKCIVTGTGAKTEFGRIADSLKTTQQSKTPLQIKFSQLTRQIGIVCVALVIIVMVTGILQGMPFAKLILFSLALIVSSVPNSLPLVVTVGLSMGAKELAKKNMIVKKLPAAEGLGSATVICSDKTGTITKNQMTVTDIYHDGMLFQVTGSGYEPRGEFFRDGQKEDAARFELLCRIACLCNNAKFSQKDGAFEILGDPTEGSLLVLSRKGGIDEERIRSEFSFVEELPFDPDRKRMSAIFRNSRTKKLEAYVKGAPDLLVSVCENVMQGGAVRPMSKEDKEVILRMNEALAAKALRVLALAYRELPEGSNMEREAVERNLTFVGLVGMMDPPRDEVGAAIEKCKRAGIRVMIITGDHALTTQAVAKQIGLFSDGDVVLTGEDVERMSDAELGAKIEQVRIIARAMPIQKLRVVEALQKRGHIVAMTGDGVNDAPALKKANIGIAMGITGSDVAKEVSEATLVDDNFATIVNAIEEGRNIYDKLIKSTKFFLSCNFGEITSVFIAVLLGFPLPLLPLQILMMNMLTDNFPALGLGFESSEDGVMERAPRNPKSNPIGGRMFFMIVVFGLIMGIGTIALFHIYHYESLIKAQTVAFTALVFFQMFAVISSRTLRPSLRHLNPFSNLWLFGAVCLALGIQLIVIYWAPLQRVFGTVPLLAQDWLLIIGVASLGFILMELGKIMMHMTIPGIPSER